jgi:hypothetical protein
MRLLGTKLHMTSAFHPQSDGQTEAANRVIVMYLRCFTGDRPRQWLLVLIMLFQLRVEVELVRSPIQYM